MEAKGTQERHDVGSCRLNNLCKCKPGGLTLNFRGDKDIYPPLLWRLAFPYGMSIKFCTLARLLWRLSMPPLYEM